MKQAQSKSIYYSQQSNRTEQALKYIASIENDKSCWFAINSHPQNITTPFRDLSTVYLSFRHDGIMTFYL